ncbi:MAG: LysR family transcriptional regulator substrate-binding protein, partial [Oscillospiraceae bacterium]|nr:LysR family transcriptional regulator substrate-binding protein [Oscillospiraceae bacterium]
HRLCRVSVCPAEELAKEPMIGLPDNSDHDIRRALAAVGSKPDICLRTKDDYAVIAMVRQGLGVSIMPSLLLHGNNDGVELRPLDPPASRTIELALPAGDIRPGAAAFAEFAAAWVRDNEKKAFSP